MISTRDDIANQKKQVKSVRLIGGSLNGQTWELNYPFWMRFGCIGDSGIPGVVLCEEYEPHPYFQNTLFCQESHFFVLNGGRN